MRHSRPAGLVHFFHKRPSRKKRESGGLNMASLVQVGSGSDSAASQRDVREGKIWVDLENSPHVPFFRPIIDELRARGYEIVVTARDAYQVRELLEFYKVPCQVVGKHYGKFKVLKVLGTLWRAF